MWSCVSSLPCWRLVATSCVKIALRESQRLPAVAGAATAAGSLDLQYPPKTGEAEGPLLQKPLRGSGLLPVLPLLTFPFATPVSCKAMNQLVTQRMTPAEDRAAPGHPASRLVLISLSQSWGEGGHSPQVRALRAEEGSCLRSLCRSLGQGWWQEGSSQDFPRAVLGRSCSRQCCQELPAAPSLAVTALLSAPLGGENGDSGLRISTLQNLV